MRGFIRTRRRGERESGERGDEIESLGQSRRREDVTLRQDARNVARRVRGRGMWRGVATQVRTHRTHGTQKIRRVPQDATPTDETQDPFLLM